MHPRDGKEFLRGDASTMNSYTTIRNENLPADAGICSINCSVHTVQEADATFVCALYFIESVVGGEGVIPDTMGLGYKAVSNSLRYRDKGRYGGTAVLDMHCDELAAPLT